MGAVAAYDEEWWAAHSNPSGWPNTGGWPGPDSPGVPGPGGGHGDGNKPPTRPAAPVCDAICQFRIHVQDLQKLSGQGRGKKTAGKTTVNPHTTGADAKGPVLGVATNDTGNDNPGGAGYTAGTSGYWLDPAGNYVNMADGTVYCGNGNSTDCELSPSTSQLARSAGQVAYILQEFAEYSEAAMAADYGAMLANHAMTIYGYDVGLSERRERTGNLFSDFTNMMTALGPGAGTVGHVDEAPPSGFENINGSDTMGALALLSASFVIVVMKSYDWARRRFGEQG